MVKVADLIAQVEYVKEGWSDAKTPAAWKELYKGKHEAAERAKAPEVKSPVLTDLAKLQDQGLGQRLPDLPEAKIVGQN